MKEFNIEYEGFWDVPELDEENAGHSVRVVQYEDDEVLEALTNADEIVTDSSTVQIIFDYPLSHKVQLGFTNIVDGEESPFSRRDFWGAVFEGYTQIYREEDGAVGSTDNIPGMLNRQRSKGPHGIWGHVIDDLFIEGVREVEPNVFELCMGS